MSDTFPPLGPPAIRHWTEVWIGRPYEAGHFECSHLVTQVLLLHYGVALKLPLPLMGSLAHSSRAWRRLADELADPVPAHRRRDGDVVHLCPIGHPAAHHLGLFVMMETGGYVLHCAADVGTCLHSPEQLSGLGWTLRGYYRPIPRES